MIKKEVLRGFLVGLIANAVGFLLAVLIFGTDDSIEVNITQSISQGFFTKLVSIGAVMNLIAFFLFLKMKRDYRARGVILATILIAIATFLVNFM